MIIFRTDILVMFVHSSIRVMLCKVRYMWRDYGLPFLHFFRNFLSALQICLFYFFSSGRFLHLFMLLIMLLTFISVTPSAIERSQTGSRETAPVRKSDAGTKKIFAEPQQCHHTQANEEVSGINNKTQYGFTVDVHKMR